MVATRNRIVMSVPREVLGSGTAAHPTLLTWCAVRRAGVLLLLAFVGLTAVWAGLGLLLTGPLAGGRLTTVDQDVARWFVGHRTPALDVWSGYGAMPAETMVKVVVTA